MAARAGAAGHPGEGRLNLARPGALRDPRFRRLFAGQALSGFGDSALYLTLYLTLGLWAKTLTGSNTAAGGGLRTDMLGGADLASANAALQTSSQGLRVLSPLVGSGLFVAFGGPSVAIFDTVTFLAAIAAIASLRVPDRRGGRADQRGQLPDDASS